MPDSTDTLAAVADSGTLVCAAETTTVSVTAPSESCAFSGRDSATSTRIVFSTVANPDSSKTTL